MPQHVILVRRLDVQNNTGRLSLEIRGCAESATDRTSSLHLVLCAETSARSTLVLVLVCSLPEVTQTSIFVSSEGDFNTIARPPEVMNVNFLDHERAECFRRCFFQ